jgi:hypothetical protein
MDPAAEEFEYNSLFGKYEMLFASLCLIHLHIDIRDLISLSDVMEELNYGPNGGLVYCME